MMFIINEVMLAVSSSLAASIAAKATVVTALALIGAWLARGSRAAVRHALLAAAFGVLLALPLASLVIPSIRIAVQDAAQERTVPPFAAAGAVPPVAPARASVGVMQAVRQSGGLSLSTLLLTAWIAGTALFLLPVAMGLWQVRSLRRSALPWRQGEPVVDRLALEAGIHRRVEVLLHESLAGPMTCGIVRPAIVLSRDAQTWEEEELNRALVHELEHVRRGDWATHCLARAVCAAYWFHPLVWMAWRHLALEAERACDDAVLGRSEATAYADQLVGLARRLSAKTPLLAMASRADLTTRVGAVLDNRQRRGRAGTLAIALACTAAALLIIAVSPLKVVAAQQQAAGTDVRSTAVPRFVTGTGLVVADVTVSDKNGRAIEGLSANDFVITEDDVPQTVSVFEFQKLTAAPATPDSVSSYYILGYYPRNESLDGAFRNIKITCEADTSANLRYRHGYYAGRRFTSINGSVSAVPGGAGSVVIDRSVGFDTPPHLISKVEPEYSEEARKAKFQGIVFLQVLVDKNGNAVNPRVMKTLGLGLDEKAMEAVRQWKFTPGMKDGKPVAVPVEVEVSFRLL